MKLPPTEIITPHTPLRLEAAAALGFPDGSITVAALRRLAAAGKVAHERIAGKYYVTLAAIEEMRDRCRVPARAETKPREPVTVKNQQVTHGADSLRVAHEHMLMTIAELRKPSPKSTLKKRQG